MKNAKKIGIAIVQVVIAGILVFVAVKHCIGDKHGDVDVGQVKVEEVEQTPVPSGTATSESATSDLETNADGYGEETLTQTEDGSYLDGEASDDEESLSDSEAEQPVATAAPAPVATPAPVQATPQPTTAPQPEQVTQPAVPQPEQSQTDGGTVPDWYDDTETAADDYDPNFDWGDTVLQ